MEITIAVNDLAHLEWAKQYFPEDLPEDWRIDYYANEFSALLSNDGTLAQEARSNFLFVLEATEISVTLQNTKTSLLVVLFSAAPIKLSSGIEITKADIISQINVTETVCILRVGSNLLVKNNEIKTLLVHIRSNYFKYDRVCLFFAHAMQDIEIINTSKIINDLL